MAIDGVGAKNSIESRNNGQESNAVDRLPEEIIEQILRLTDGNGFASLVLLNRKWRTVSQTSELYIHHLSRCPSYAASHSKLPTADDKNLPTIRRIFAREVKRNLLEAYLRPNETAVKLMSNSISSSSVPGGEGMQFSASPRARHVLAYNSSRIYVLDVSGPGVEVKREFKILRRPASVCIDDGCKLLATLSSEMQVDVYDLSHSPPKRTQSMILDHAPRTIAMSSCGSVLAAAYEGGVEVCSLNAHALQTERRAVKCDGVDSLAFSFDGTQILGTTAHSSPPSTVVLTAPYYDPGSHAPDDTIAGMWTTSILFPNTSRDCSHAVLLQEGDHEEAAWVFAYDSSFEAFRAVRIDDLRNGTTYFTGPMPQSDTQGKLLPSTLPATTQQGEVVAAGFQGKEIWVYGVPEDLDAVCEPTPSSSSQRDSGPSLGLGRRNSDRSSLSRKPSTRNQDDDSRVPQWQLLCDRQRNTLVAGTKVSELAGVSCVKWVSGFGGSSIRERLVITAPGISSIPRLVTEEEDMDFVDGGRLTLVDFDYGLNNGKRTEVTIEVGTDSAEVLEEEQRDIETEVAIVRRRTVAQKKGKANALLRAATTASRLAEVPDVPRFPDDQEDDPLVPRRIGRDPSSSLAGPAKDEANDEDLSIEEQEAMDAPYAHSSPRSGSTLRRAATAAAVNRIRNPRTADGRPIEYRRADGRAEHPHESDADNWVPPPPPYQKDAPPDIPAFLRGPAVVAQPSAQIVSAVKKDQPSGSQSPYQRPLHQRTASDSTTYSSRLRTEDHPRPKSSPSAPADIEDDIYDVTPPTSPRPPRGIAVSGSGFSDDQRIASGSSSAVSSTAPNLQLQVAQSKMVEGAVSNVLPRTGGLSNAQTWPTAPHQPGAESTAHVAGYPLSAPVADFRPASQRSGPVLNTVSDQLEDFQPPVLQGYPRRPSGSSSLQRVPVGSKREQSSPVLPPPIPGALPQTDSWQTEPDQPLIIATPKGVTGAFDPPNRRVSGRRNETPILAPIPRHPRPMHASGPRPTVEALETIYNPQSSARQRRSQSTSNLFSKWLAPASNSSSRRTDSTSRRHASRAERSAARNMQDARRRGWKGPDPASDRRRRKKNKAESEAGWTDVTTASVLKDKKCVIM